MKTIVSPSLFGKRKHRKFPLGLLHVMRGLEHLKMFHFL